MGQRPDGAGNGFEARHGRGAVVAGPHIAVGERRLAAERGRHPGALESAVIEQAVIMPGVVGGNRDIGVRQARKILRQQRKIDS